MRRENPTALYRSRAARAAPTRSVAPARGPPTSMRPTQRRSRTVRGPSAVPRNTGRACSSSARACAALTSILASARDAPPRARPSSLADLARRPYSCAVLQQAFLLAYAIAALRAIASLTVTRGGATIAARQAQCCVLHRPRQSGGHRWRVEAVLHVGLGHGGDDVRDQPGRGFEAASVIGHDPASSSATVGTRIAPSRSRASDLPGPPAGVTRLSPP